ncbi:MAG: hypothetical protein ACI971_001605, partial [Colwellia sp.]
RSNNPVNIFLICGSLMVAVSSLQRVDDFINSFFVERDNPRVNYLLSGSILPWVFEVCFYWLYGDISGLFLLSSADSEEVKKILLYYL